MRKLPGARRPQAAIVSAYNAAISSGQPQNRGQMLRTPAIAAILEHRRCYHRRAHNGATKERLQREQAECRLLAARTRAACRHPFEQLRGLITAEPISAALLWGWGLKSHIATANAADATKMTQAVLKTDLILTNSREPAAAPT